MLKNKLKLYLLLTILLSSHVVFAAQKIDFKNVLYRDFLFSQDVQVLRKDLVNTDSLIDRPKLTWVPLFRSYVFGKLDAACLYYLIPKLDGKFVRKGMLKLVRVSGAETCQDKFVRKGIFTIKDITGLTVYSNLTANIEKRGTENVPPFHIRIHLERNNKREKMDFPLYNFRKPFRERFSRFGSLVPDALEQGVTLIDPIVKPVFSKRYMGKQTDSYPDGNLKICHDVNEKCQEKTPFICNRCKFGWFEVVSGNCSTGGPKYCGPNLCGKKGWPACLRGTRYNNNKGIACEDGSTAGFCEGDLKTFCDENKILICL